MDGYKTMTLQAIDLSLFALALIKESYAAILPTDLGKSVNYAWEGLTGVGAWLGAWLGARLGARLGAWLGAAVQLLCRAERRAARRS